MSPRGSDEIDALFALPLESFTAERDRLAKQLAASGDKDAARSVKGLRKPSVVAWVLNQLARTQADRLQALFETGDAMARSLQGNDPVGARDAQAKRRSLLKEIGGAAAGILREGGHATASHVDKVRSTLLQATTDQEIAAAISEGRLGREPQGDALPDAFDAVVAGPEDDDAEDAGDKRRRERLEQKIDDLRGEAEAAARRAAQLARDAESARVAADAAEETAVVAQRAADRVLRHLEEAEAELRGSR